MLVGPEILPGHSLCSRELTVAHGVQIRVKTSADSGDATQLKGKQLTCWIEGRKKQARRLICHDFMILVSKVNEGYFTTLQLSHLEQMKIPVLRERKKERKGYLVSHMQKKMGMT